MSDLQEKDTPRHAQYCFVGHSNEAPWRADILSACAEVLPKFGLEPWYAADHYELTRTLCDKVVEAIANARYGIYDLSSWQDDKGAWHLPRNVLIELGTAIVYNRPTLLLRHSSNRVLPLPVCLQGVELLEFGGDETLKKALEVKLPQWIETPPERDWLNRFCIFGNRVCIFREQHPRGEFGEGTSLPGCHIADGLDRDEPGCQNVDRDEIHRAFDHVLSRYANLPYRYLSETPLPDGFRFQICSYCQTVRATAFGIYRILPHGPEDVFLSIGMSIAVGAFFGYGIPRVLVVQREEELPSLLRGYEVLEARSSNDLKRGLKARLPVVMQKLSETQWKPRPLPFAETAAWTSTHPGPEGDQAVASMSQDELAELIQAALASGNARDYITGRLTVQPEATPVIHLEPMLTDLVQRMIAIHPRCSVSLDVDPRTASKVRIRAYQEWLTRAFEIVLDNAMTAAGNQGRVTISARIRDRRMEISITDNGLGIPEEIRQKLFKEPIAKADRGDHIGVGLLIANVIVGTYGGQMRVEDTGSNGTTMVVQLPIMEERLAQASILIADNDARVRDVLKTSLESAGYSVVEAASLRDAQRALLAHRPDLVVADLRLTNDEDDRDITGLELAAMVRKTRTPCILLTAYPSIEVARLALRRQGAEPGFAVDLLTMSDGPQVLLEAVDRALASEVGDDVPAALVIDPVSRQVWKRGKELDLPPLEYQLLRYLYEKRGQICTRDEVFREVYGQAMDTGDEPRLNLLVTRLRYRLEDDPDHPQLLLTVRGKGYRLVAS